MSIVENKIIVKDLVTKSNLPASDYVINPYVGCPHGCRYCYACFMKRFTGHSEEWGSFIDIKQCDKPISQKKLQGKSVFLSSVTDCYNPFEEKYKITRKGDAGAVSFRCNERLYLQREGLQRRRGKVQYQLHPGCWNRYSYRLPFRSKI